MKTGTILTLFLASSFSFAVGVSGGGDKPRANSFVYSLSEDPGFVTFAVGKYEGTDWKTKQLKMSVSSLPNNVIDALNRSKSSQSWDRIQE